MAWPQGQPIGSWLEEKCWRLFGWKTVPCLCSASKIGVAIWFVYNVYIHVFEVVCAHTCGHVCEVVCTHACTVICTHACVCLWFISLSACLLYISYVSLYCFVAVSLFEWLHCLLCFCRICMYCFLSTICMWVFFFFVVLRVKLWG